VPLPRPAYSHRGGDVPLRWQTVDQAFQAIVAVHGDREALVAIPQRTRLTYHALDARVQACARGLLALGLAAGDRLAVYGTNGVEWLTLQLATARVGVVLVTLNPAWRADELRDALARAEVHVLALQPGFRKLDYVATLAEACPEIRTARPGVLRSAVLPHLRHVVLFDPDAPDRAGVPADAPAVVAWPDLLARGAAVPDATVTARGAGLDPDAPINIQFTSGTTGRPKAAVLSHHNIVNNGFFVGEQLALEPADRVCVPVPFYRGAHARRGAGGAGAALRRRRHHRRGAR
jgi:fatty-acyl-CoA synthase